MKFILISDVHVDINRWDPDCLNDCSPDCNTIVVAGDISNDVWTTSKWIVDLKKSWENVIWVPGNHDYYNTKFDRRYEVDITLDNKYPFPKYQNEIRTHYKNWSNDHGIIFLDHRNVIIDGVNFLGATGWHNFVAGEPYSKDQQIDAWYNKSADRIINWRDQPQDWVIVEENAINDASFIRESVATSTHPCVVVTHHLPHRMLSATRPYDIIWTKLHGMFVNTYCENINNSNIKYWCYGHTHFRNMRELNGITYVCNPVGYPGENFNWSKVELEV